MDRYQIIIQEEFGWSEIKMTPVTDEISLINQFWFCINNKKILDVREYDLNKIERSLIRLSKDSKTPLVLPDQSKANILSIVYRHKSIYSPDNFPEGDVYGILYMTAPFEFGGIIPWLIIKSY